MEYTAIELILMALVAMVLGYYFIKKKNKENIN